MSTAAAVLTAKSEDHAVNALHQARRTDGLPVIVPTPERVDRMLLHAGSMDRDLVIGTVGPADGLLTFELAAINAVMAGCDPEMFPLVVAACEALTDPVMEIGPLQHTTHPLGIFAVVNGPAREWFGVHSGSGALGPGYRTNATLGRAIRLIMINVGGGVPGIGDMSTLGSPTKFGCSMAEDEERSPFDALHVSRGFAADDSTVTLLGCDGPHSLVFQVNDPDKDGDTFLRVLAGALANPAWNNIHFGKGMVAVVLNPTHADMLQKSGFTTREAVQQRIFELAAVSRSQIMAKFGTMAQYNQESKDGDTIRVVNKPEDILLLTGGGEGGGYSAYFTSWGGGLQGNMAVTKRVRFDAGCAAPVSQRS
ncbi:hypothetical protein [Sphingobium subterraneum]|uniref:Uncharacterized protein n=1 Tax=Sphingobium subterraneum TaxID=627688 RepID=A0A841IWR1_9SPHN|nr:hypothetical protein [Sphingobium subterraneum]MBB6123379.1 hypothetical protein [Sphingobium subterraneum]